MPFAGLVGIELHPTTPVLVTGSLPWSPERGTAGGVRRGGAVLSRADTVGAVCAFLTRPDGASTATIDSTTRMIRPLTTGAQYAEARSLHVGRTVIVVTTDLTDDRGRPVAHTSQAHVAN